MVRSLTSANLLRAAARVGIALPSVARGKENLYLWTNDNDEVIYVGRAASLERLRRERGWLDDLDPRTDVVSGIVTLLRANQAKPIRLRYESEEFDSDAAMALSENWDGPAFAELEARLRTLPPDVGEIEQVLIRIAVRYGAPLGNSQFASQWENPIGSLSDTLAVLAVDSDDQFELPLPVDEDE